MSFDEFCRSNAATYTEKDALAWHLVMLRARQAYEQLRPQPRWPSRGRVSRARDAIAKALPLSPDSEGKS